MLRYNEIVEYYKQIILNMLSSDNALYYINNEMELDIPIISHNEIEKIIMLLPFQVNYKFAINSKNDILENSIMRLIEQKLCN